VVAIVSVAAVHEHVHERTKEQRQVKKRAKQMGTVLGEQQNSDDREEAKKNNPSA
jgi:hypothetical protein